MVKYRRKLITFACTKLCTMKDYPHIMSPLNLPSTVVRHHRRGGGGNGPLLVAGAENSVKVDHPDGQRGWKLCLKGSHIRMGLLI